MRGVKLLVIAGILTVVISVVLITASAMLSTKYIPLSMAKDDYRPPAASWLNEDASWISKHWTLFNMIAAGSSLVMALIALFCTPYGRALVENRIGDPDISMAFLCIEAAAMLGFHLVWSSALDWRYHKIPRWALVMHMTLQVLITVACLQLSTNFKFYTLSVVLASIMCWLLGTVPGSGMSDGRLYVIAASTSIPFLGVGCWLPVVVAAVAAIINAVVSTFTGGAVVHAERQTKKSLGKRLLTAKSPMGPFISVSFTILFMIYTTGLFMW